MSEKHTDLASEETPDAFSVTLWIYPKKCALCKAVWHITEEELLTYPTREWFCANCEKATSP